MSWLQLEVTLVAAQVAPVEAALTASGAQSVTLIVAADQPLCAPNAEHLPVRRATRLTALFPADTDRDGLRAVLSTAGEALPHHRFSTVADRNWSRAWLKDFKPMRFGRRLSIVPNAYRPPEPSAVNIRLDPGLAFGTGTHATTALCLEWLNSAELHGRRVIDYGCGSGILAIAAVRLGAERVWAVDTDPQALLATRANALRNRVSTRIIVRAAQRARPAAAEVLLANILAAPLCALAPRFAALVQPGSRLVLSGVLASQRSEVEAAYAGSFSIVNVVQRQGWLRIDGLRRPERAEC
ncbi:MAG: 50S ribosomal protein L11 methyltransferase [Gammaproteobacteria bacterium]